VDVAIVRDKWFVPNQRPIFPDLDRLCQWFETASMRRIWYPTLELSSRSVGSEYLKASLVQLKNCDPKQHCYRTLVHAEHPRTSGGGMSEHHP
jgi:hypothetical protein